MPTDPFLTFIAAVISEAERDGWQVWRHLRDPHRVLFLKPHRQMIAARLQREGATPGITQSPEHPHLWQVTWSPDDWGPIYRLLTNKAIGV